MVSLSPTAGYIRFQLQHLSPDNGHHQFEHLCRQFARAVITPNILPATGPVSAGGDRGIDFHTFRDFPLDSDEAVEPAQRFWRNQRRDIAFACSLEKDPETGRDGKIRRDVARIAEHPEGFAHVVFFSSQPIQQASRMDLVDWAEETFSIDLQIFDGPALAERLACKDVIEIARRHLGLPDGLEPDPVPARPRVVLPPLDVSGFRGRKDQLDTLERFLLGKDSRTAVGIWGGPGTGKSALAVAFARRFAGHFPDGVYGADLRQLRDVKAVAVALARLVPDPPTDEELGELSASEIMQIAFGGRRCLVVLDNLEPPEGPVPTGSAPEAPATALRDLLPQGGRCRCLVTAGDRQVLTAAGISAPAHLELLSLDREEALDLVEAQTGREAMDREPEAVDEILDLTGRLPLALRIASRTVALTLEPRPFAALVGELAEPATRIDGFREPIPQGDVLRPVLEVALRRLEEAERDLFGQLGACTPSGFSRETAIAVAALPRLEARPLLTHLVHAGLLEHSAEQDRFRFHTLLHLFAREQGEERGLLEVAEERHLDYFTRYLDRHREPTADNVTALVTEETALLRILDELARGGKIEPRLLPAINMLLDQTGGWAAGAEILEKAREAVELDPWTSMVLDLQRGKNLLRQNRVEEAIQAFQESLQVAEELGDQRGVAMALNSLGGARRHQGDLDNAVEAFQQSLRIKEELGDQRGIAMVLNSLGGALRNRGDLDAAVEAFQQSLRITEELGDQRGVAMALNSLGGARRDQGDLDAAVKAFQQSLRILQELGDQRGIAMVLNSLGGARREQGRLRQALDVYERCREIQRDHGLDVGRAVVAGNAKKLRACLRKIDAAEDPVEEARIRARFHLQMGKGLSQPWANDFAGAQFHFQHVLRLTGDDGERAEAHFGLGQAAFRLRRHELAATHLDWALGAGLDSSVLRTSYGSTLHQLDAPLAAVASQFEKALEHDPENAWAHSWYGLALGDHGRQAEAEAHGRRAVEILPGHGALLNNLARILLASGEDPKCREARSLLERSAALGKGASRFAADLLRQLDEQEET